EEEGLTVTIHGKGTFVSAMNTERMLEEQKKEIEAEFEKSIAKGKAYGISAGELKELFELVLED
ncbi:MAG: GntR family transcriptional regulator, partial [Lachnospiraceae bacterium]|nr:GntR family transcriptional regulator [Lachnospiraceae bacterium]